MAEQKGQSFLKGTVILTAATFVVKFINIFFSIPLANFLGGEGMGHFYTAYDIFIFFSVLATSGTPVAISRMVSMAYAQGRKREADKIFRVSFLLFSVIGMAGCLVMFVFARQFSILMTQGDRSMYAIAALAPMVLFMSLSSCLRGYFQGRSNMTPTAVSQVLESVVKLFVGIALALYLLKTTGLPELGAAGAIIGVSVGSLFAVLYILVYYFKKRAQTRYMVREVPVSSTKSILRDIVVFAVPVIVGSTFLSLLDLVDSSVMMYRLQGAVGLDEGTAMAMKGWLGNARKYFDLPNAVIVPISTAVLPLLAGVIAKNDRRGTRETSTLALRGGRGGHGPASDTHGARRHHGEPSVYDEFDDSGGRQGAYPRHQHGGRHRGAHHRRLRALRHPGDQCERRGVFDVRLLSCHDRAERHRDAPRAAGRPERDRHGGAAAARVAHHGRRLVPGVRAAFDVRQRQDRRGRRDRRGGVRLCARGGVHKGHHARRGRPHAEGRADRSAPALEMTAFSLVKAGAPGENRSGKFCGG